MGHHVQVGCFGFFADLAHKVSESTEPGIELVRVPRIEWSMALSPPAFTHALHLASLYLAERAGLLALHPDRVAR